MNLGLLCFAAGALTYLTEGWDPTSFFCTAGYLLCGLGMALPPGLCFNKRKDLGDIGSPRGEALLHEDARAAMACHSVYRAAGTTFNVVGLLLGIVGSLMYSPTVNAAIWGDKADESNEHEWLRHYANVMWAVSFFLFPIGVGFFLYDRLEVMRVHNLATGKPPPSVFDRNLRVLVWSELMLLIFAVGGVFFCADFSQTAEVTSWVLFFCGGCIKVGLLFSEVMDMCLGTNIAGGRGAEVDMCGSQRGVKDNGGKVTKNGPDDIAPAKDTSAMLGDPGGG